MSKDTELQIAMEEAHHSMLAKKISVEDADQAINMIHLELLECIDEIEPLNYLPIPGMIDGWLTGVIDFSVSEKFFRKLHMKLGGSYLGGFVNV